MSNRIIENRTDAELAQVTKALILFGIESLVDIIDTKGPFAARAKMKTMNISDRTINGLIKDHDAGELDALMRTFKSKMVGVQEETVNG